MKKSELIKTITAIFDPKDYCHFEIEITQGKNQIDVRIEQMYEYVEVGFKRLLALSKVFETENIDVDEWHSGGCDTCDYGSQYVKTFQIKDSKLKIEKDVE
jgi:hypothetical protein